MNASNASKDGELNSTKNRTTVEPRSEREIVVTRSFDAPARIVFQAWTTPALFRRWWVPKSMPLALLSYEADIRAGGGYRLVFDVDGTNTMAFFGKYLEVTPHSRIVWTNDESGEDGAVTTVTLEEKNNKTLLVLHELYRSKELRDAALTSGAYDGMGETFDQLDEVLATAWGARGGRLDAFIAADDAKAVARGRRSFFVTLAARSVRQGGGPDEPTNAARPTCRTSHAAALASDRSGAAHGGWARRLDGT